MPAHPTLDACGESLTPLGGWGERLHCPQNKQKTDDSIKNSTLVLIAIAILATRRDQNLVVSGEHRLRKRTQYSEGIGKAFPTEQLEVL